MKKCIICNKEINSQFVVNLDEEHSTHLECWTDKIPNTKGIYASKEDKEKRSKKIQKIASELIEEYKNKCK